MARRNEPLDPPRRVTQRAARLDDDAWPLGRHLVRRYLESRQLACAMPPLERRSRRLDRFCVLLPHPFQVDRLGGWLHQRTTLEQTYSRGVRVKSDQELPGDVLDAIQHGHMPQFNLRNIGRAELDVDPTDPLPLQAVAGLGGTPGKELEAVRAARLEPPRLAEVWSTRLMATVRASLRRLVLEDPWAARLGPEATSAHDGPQYRFVVEGTHPDDLPHAWWGPEPVPLRAQVAAPDGTPAEPDMLAVMRKLTSG